MLTFLEAIEEVEKSTPTTIDWDTIIKDVTEAIRRKNLTASDVHVPTALGNERRSKPSRRFKELLSALEDSKPDHVVQLEDEDGSTGARPVALRDWSVPLTILKAQADQQLIFGWASIVTKNGQAIVDKQDDVIMPEDLEKAAYDFVLYSRTQGDMHDQKGVGRLIESMVFTKQKQDLLGIDLGLEGWFVGFKVDNDEVWTSIKAGNRPDFSIGGKGERVEI